jgi:hypothetical protein
LELTDEEMTWLQAPMGHAVYGAAPKPKTTSSAMLQVPTSSRPPLDAKQKEKQRTSGFRRIFPKQKK